MLPPLENDAFLCFPPKIHLFLPSSLRSSPQKGECVSCTQGQWQHLPPYAVTFHLVYLVSPVSSVLTSTLSLSSFLNLSHHTSSLASTACPCLATDLSFLALLHNPALLSTRSSVSSHPYSSVVTMQLPLSNSKENGSTKVTGDLKAVEFLFYWPFATFKKVDNISLTMLSYDFQQLKF